MSFNSTIGKQTGLGGQIGNKNVFGSANLGGKNFSFGTPWENMKNAAEAQSDWISQAAAARRAGYDQGITEVKDRLGSYAPFGQTASTQLNSLLTDPSSLRTMPGYQFRLQEGENGLARTQTQYRLGGRALKEMERYRQDYADTSYGNEVNRLTNVANTGYGMDSNTSRMLADLYVKRGLSNAQEFGDYSQYAFWHEQQGMDEAKQWSGSFRGMLFGGGMGGGMGGGGGGGGGNGGGGRGSSYSGMGSGFQYTDSYGNRY